MPEISDVDRVIAHLTEEDPRPGMDDGTYDIWTQAELSFLGCRYVIVAQPSGWIDEQCTLFRTFASPNTKEMTELSLPHGADRSHSSLPALCTLAYNDALITWTAEMNTAI